MNSETPHWFKSSRSGSEGGNCVETAGLVDAVGVRDSKNPARGHLSLSPTAWSALTESMKD
ncbi:DUF397 domain-containing protein [Streptomycetaceae bacterium NBC_01309]